LQILLDLTQNPNTSSETRRAVEQHGGRLLEAWHPLFARALGDAADEADLVRYAFGTLRGYLQGRLIASSIADCSDDRAERELLIRGVASAITSEAARRGVSIDGR
jgi:hypothetical protein